MFFTVEFIVFTVNFNSTFDTVFSVSDFFNFFSAKFTVNCFHFYLINDINMINNGDRTAIINRILDI